MSVLFLASVFCSQTQFLTENLVPERGKGIGNSGSWNNVPAKWRQLNGGQRGHEGLPIAAWKAGDTRHVTGIVWPDCHPPGPPWQADTHRQAGSAGGMGGIRAEPW